jgi:phosphatidylserine decarboxylase
MKSLDEWLATDVEEFQKLSLKTAAHSAFFRDPPRPLRCNRDVFMASADGVITTQGRFTPDEDLFDVKGAQCSVNDLLGHQQSIDKPALVSATFMSFADVHVNRAASDCTMTRFPLPPLKTRQVPMLFVERNILNKGKVAGGMEFMRDNQRVVNKCFCPYLKYWYFLVQIADQDVDCIVPFREGRTVTLNQSQRFGMIRWGSMVVTILPLDSRYRFRPCCKVSDHVEAGVDAIVRVEAL